ncbi:MAG: YbjQ family protein [Spirochaetes bacterium]|nr:YbjQ family protein [Spirochaetota bacterium]
MPQLIIIITLIILGYITGSIAEKKHFTSIRKREAANIATPAVSISKALEDERNVEEAYLAHGCAVISMDYFKRFLAGLRNIFGGEIGAYESLVDRARREATLRMKESAKNADIILNIRIETSTIGRSNDNNRSMGSIEAFVYGTAITYKK